MYVYCLGVEMASCQNASYARVRPRVLDPQPHGVSVLGM